MGRVAVVLGCSLLVGCLRYEWRVTTVRPAADSDPVAPVTMDVPSGVTLRRSEQRANHFLIENKSNAMLFVSHRESAVEIDGVSLRVIPGTQLRIRADQDAPDTPIAPNTSAEVSFYTASPEANEFLAELGTAAQFRIAVRSASETRYAVVKPEGVVTSAGMVDRLLCYVTGIAFGGWCWFVSPGEDDARSAAAKAAAIHGAAAADVEYLGRQ
jgi:hypothetical protein